VAEGRVGSMREIERVRRRQRWRERTDRLTTVLVVGLVVTALLTLLPQQVQQRIVALGCAGVTLGVTDCVARLYEPPPAAVRAVPLCPVDQVAEQMVPTVEMQRISFAQGGVLQRWVARDGTIRIVAEPDDRTATTWQGEDWPTAPLLAGVAVPLSAQWRFTESRQEQDFVAALQQQHAQHHQRRSAVSALLPGEVDAGVRRITRPTAWVARTPHDQLSGLVTPASGAGEAAPGQVRVSGDSATVLHDEGTGAVATTVESAGTSPSGAPVLGALRWVRSDDGTLVELSGSWVWQEADEAMVVHLFAPLAEGDGEEVETWLASSADGGPVLDLFFLTAERAPEVGNEMERLLYAAGTVATERRAQDAAALQPVLTEHLAMDRRPFGELDAARSSTSIVRPQPSGADRVPQEVQC
jgi:hypothetical protein